MKKLILTILLISSFSVFSQKIVKSSDKSTRVTVSVSNYTPANNTPSGHFTGINTALSTKSNLSGTQTFTGVHNFPTASLGTNTAQVATTAFVNGENSNNVKLTGDQTISGVKTFSDSPIVPTATTSGQAVNKGQLDLKANLASPVFTGTPTAPTPTVGTNTAQVATTAFVQINKGSFSSDIDIKGVNFGTGGGSSFQNTIAGRLALNNNITGVQITAIGTQNLQNSTTNNGGNTSVGAYGFLNLIDGGNNTSLGDDSGRYYGGSTSILTNSVDGLFLGNDSRPLSNTSVNEIVIGKSAIGNGNNTTTIGNSSTVKTYLKGIIEIGSYTVATLPTPTGTAYATVYDALAPTYMATVVGGGTVVTPVFYNGANWVCH